MKDDPIEVVVASWFVNVCVLLVPKTDKPKYSGAFKLKQSA